MKFIFDKKLSLVFQPLCGFGGQWTDDFRCKFKLAMEQSSGQDKDLGTG